MEDKLNDLSDEASITVDPGICGFTCLIRAHRVEEGSVAIEITGSECQQIKKWQEILKLSP